MPYSSSFRTRLIVVSHCASVEEAAGCYPELTVNSLNAVAKLDDAGAVSSVRLVLDGTHGVVVNRAITQRDQDRCLVAGDVRRVQRE